MPIIVTTLVAIGVQVAALLVRRGANADPGKQVRAAPPRRRTGARATPARPPDAPAERRAA